MGESRIPGAAFQPITRKLEPIMTQLITFSHPYGCLLTGIINRLPPGDVCFVFQIAVTPHYGFSYKRQ